MGETSAPVRLTFGTLAIVLAVALSWYQVSTGLYVPVAMGIAASVAGYGVYLLVGGGRTVRHPSVAPLPDLPIVPLPDDELARRLDTDPLPFGVCTICRMLDSPPAFHGRCPRCDAASDYLVVEHEAERSLARSAAGRSS